MSADARPVFLVGFMGSGKSTVGRLLAQRAGREFLDTDALVEASDGRSIDRIFRESGEGRFRQLEWDALSALDGRERCVVATGGGLFLGHDRRAWIRRRGPSVWLDVSLTRARDRIGEGDSRPLWLPGDPVGLRAFFEKRRACYALADVRIDASSAPPEEQAAEIERRLGWVFP